MQGFFIFIIVILLPYYLVYCYRKYKRSNSKREFFHSSFFLLNYWMFGITLLSFLAVNNIFPDKSEEGTGAQISIEIQMDSLNKIRLRNPINLDSNFNYVQKYFKIHNSDQKANQYQDSIQNCFRSMASASTVDSLQVGRICMSYFKYKLNEIDSATYYIKTGFDPQLKYGNYILGLINLRESKDTIAVNFFKHEIALSNGYLESYRPLISYYKSEKNFKELIKILYDPAASEYISRYLATDLYFLNQDFINYYGGILKILSKRVNSIGVLAAILIMIVWMHYLRSMNLFDKVSIGRSIMILALGIAFIFLVFPISDYNQLILDNHLNGEYWNDFKYSVFGIGLIEEIVKILPVIIIMSVTKWIKEPYQFIYYASISALGFALVENVLYFQKHYTTIIHARSLTSAVGHMIFSSLIAYGFVLVKFKFKNPKLYVPIFLLFWLLGSLSHGLYDYWLFMDLNFFFYLYFFISIGTWSKVVNNCINNSTNFNNAVIYDPARIQLMLVLSLAGILFFEYFSVGQKYGASVANESLTYSLFNGSLVMLFVGSRLSSLDIVKGFWQPFRFKLNPFSGQALTQNFVNKEVFIRSLPNNELLNYLMPEDMSGKIIDRLILNKTKNESSSRLEEDPYWFVLKLDSKISLKGADDQHLLIKLKDSYEALNEGKNFWVMVASIPSMDLLDSSEIMRNQFPTYGWAFINEI